MAQKGADDLRQIADRMAQKGADDLRQIADRMAQKGADDLRQVAEKKIMLRKLAVSFGAIFLPILLIIT